jgi:DNA-binding response OmpR family regulator
MWAVLDGKLSSRPNRTPIWQVDTKSYGIVGAPAVEISVPSGRGRVNAEASRLVVVADDDASIRRLVARHLRRLDCDVLQARDGEEALRLALEHEPDLLIVDIRMPGLSGYEVTREIRRLLAARVRVLLVSGSVSSAEIAEGYAAGVDAYLKKPFAGEELLEQVQALLRPAGNGRGTA